MLEFGEKQAWQNFIVFITQLTKDKNLDKKMVKFVSEQSQSGSFFIYIAVSKDHKLLRWNLLCCVSKMDMSTEHCIEFVIISLVYI